MVYPLTRPTVCTVARAKKVIGLITTVALVAFSYVWVIATVIPVSDQFDDSNSTIISGEGDNSTLDSGKQLIYNVANEGLALRRELKQD